MLKSIIILGSNDELSYYCSSCYNEEVHRKLGECQFDVPEECDMCDNLISFDEDDITIVTKITWKNHLINLWYRTLQYFRGQ